MNGKDIVEYFFDRVIGSTILRAEDLSSSYWNETAAWLESKVSICAEPFIKKLACDIVREIESSISDDGRFPEFNETNLFPCILFDDYRKNHSTSESESSEMALAGTNWNLESR